MTTPIALSVLDTCPISADSTGAQALHRTINLAQAADRLGYTRYWVAEHHNTGIQASAAPEILIGHVAAMTTHIRVGSGGIMLPNHVPLHVVEQFRTLEVLHPQRIDLGIGRGPGADERTVLALRRSSEELGADDFPDQLDELLAFADEEFPDGHPFATVRAVPLDVPLPPLWLLGSSVASAQLAAELGMGFAFAHFINPAGAVEALQHYHREFTPSRRLRMPTAILAVSAICADTDAEAAVLGASLDLSFVRGLSGDFGPLPSPAEAVAYPYTDEERRRIKAFHDRRFMGDPSTMSACLQALLRQTQVSEVMIISVIHDHAARVHSYELLATAFGLQPPG